MDRFGTTTVPGSERNEIRMKLGASRGALRKKIAFFNAIEAAQGVSSRYSAWGTSPRETPGAKEVYCPDSSSSPMKRTAGMGTPFRLAGAKVALTSDTINNGVEPELSPPSWAATTLPW